MRPHEKGRAADAVPALPKSFGGDTSKSTGTVQHCPMSCSPSCSFRCPVAIDEAVTALVFDLLAEAS
jgi:hypothetical protein